MGKKKKKEEPKSKTVHWTEFAKIACDAMRRHLEKNEDLYK